MDLDTANVRGSDLSELESPVGRVIQQSLLSTLTAPEYRPPVLPALALQLIGLSRKPSVSMRQIAGLIEQDPVLTADMLRLTHSALLALNSPIRSVEEALMRLGVRRSTELFMRAAVGSKLFRCRSYAQVLERLRRHSVATAEISRVLCQAAAVPEESVYLIGLLHDVGIAVCILALGSDGPLAPLPAFEEAWPAIRAMHQRFALHLVTKWSLPKEIRSGLVRHFAYANDNAPVSVASVTILAESLTQRIDLGFENESASEIASIAQSHLRLGDSTIQRIVEGLSGLTQEC